MAFQPWAILLSGMSPPVLLKTHYVLRVGPLGPASPGTGDACPNPSPANPTPTLPGSRSLLRVPQEACLASGLGKLCLFPPFLLIWQEAWKLSWKALVLTNAPKSGL